VLAENIAKTVGIGARLLIFVGEDGVRHLAPETRRKSDQTFAVLGQQFVVHAGFVVENHPDSRWKRGE